MATPATVKLKTEGDTPEMGVEDNSESSPLNHTRNQDNPPSITARFKNILLWSSGLSLLPVWWMADRLLHPGPLASTLLIAAAVGLAPVPALLLGRKRYARLRLRSESASEELAELRLHLETVRYRYTRLREELATAGHQARFFNHLSLLGQFTAGFLHEFNNPLAVLTSRIQVLQDERNGDSALCADLQQMLQETRYMRNIAGTLLRALNQQRAGETYTPCIPAVTLMETIEMLRPVAERQGVRLIPQLAETPRVNLPSHVLQEVARNLINNAIEALAPRKQGTIWVRAEPCHQPSARVILRIVDDGPGVPEQLRNELFKPFISANRGREHLGLGLFLAASLLDIYNGTLRYETRPDGGAVFVLEIPPARFTLDQPYHWSAKGVAS